MNKLSILALALALALCAPLALADTTAAEVAETAAVETAAPVETAVAEAPDGTPLPTEDASAADAAAVPEATAAPALTLSTVLATVNGVDVSYADVKKYYDTIAAQYGSMFDVTDPSISGPLKEMSINYAVTEQVVKQKAQELGLDKFTDEELAELQANADESYKQAYDQVAAMFTSQGIAADQLQSTVEAYLADYNYTPSVIFGQMKDAKLFERAFNTVTGDLDIEEAELKVLFDERVAAAKAAYEANLGQYDTDVSSGNVIYFVPEGVRSVKHILVKMDGAEAAELKNALAELDALPEDDPGRAALVEKIEGLKAPVQAKLDEIQQKIDAGEDFNALIDAYGEDPGMMEGQPNRDTGYTLSASTTIYDPPFQAAAMALEKPGDVSEPTLGAYGYHFIRYDHDIESKEADFEVEKAAMKEAELSARKTELQNQAIEAWTAAATVETFPDRFTA